MSLKDLSKNKAVVTQLERLLNSDMVVHAFLFAGGSREDRIALGTEFVKVLADRPEDIIEVVKPDDRASIGTQQIGELQKKLILTPFGSNYAVLINDAELLTEEAQNKLLKTLEEPSNAIIVLLSERKEAMLRTVLSRCAVYELEEPQSEIDSELSNLAFELLKILSADGNYYQCKSIIEELLSKKDDSRERAIEFLNILEVQLLTEIKNGNTALLNIADACKQARKYIKQGHNTAYTLKHMCLSVQARR